MFEVNSYQVAQHYLGWLINAEGSGLCDSDLIQVRRFEEDLRSAKGEGHFSAGNSRGLGWCEISDHVSEAVEHRYYTRIY